MTPVFLLAVMIWWWCGGTSAATAGVNVVSTPLLGPSDISCPRDWPKSRWPHVCAIVDKESAEEVKTVINGAVTATC